MKLSTLLLLLAFGCGQDDSGTGSSSSSPGLSLLTLESVDCSQETNQWGHPKTCQCPEASSYLPKVGRCSAGKNVDSPTLNYGSKEKTGIQVK